MSTIVLCAWLLVAAWTPAAVPDPRPGGLVVDPAGVLDPATEAALDARLRALRADRGAEVALVVLDDVVGAPKAFATALFNRWRLGDAARDDGVLVLMVMGQRRLEIETRWGVGLWRLISSMKIRPGSPDCHARSRMRFQMSWTVK